MKDFLKVIVFGGLFLVPLLPVYVESDFFFPFITGKNFAFRILIEVVCASWILLALADVRYRPRFSWILAGFSALLVVMFFANLFGEYPHKSFWSNFERMDGYVTLIHLFAYTFIAGSVLTTDKLWSYFFNFSVAIALFVAVYGLAQHGGLIEGGRARIDSRLGNAAYMAVYMLFHIFIVLWLFVRSKVSVHKIMYACMALLFIYTLLLTGTRGTFLGFIGGMSVAVGYVALFGRQYPELRKIAIGGCLAVVIIILGFWSVKDSSFVQSSGPLARIASLNIQKDLETRGVIWSMALEGVKERPLLGWGQGNFNYVFNKNFEPVLYNKEAWFDRVHDIVLDWLIAGGVLGFLAYASIFVAPFYYLFWLPIWNKNQHFDVLERAVLLGLVVGYLMHNLVVFDNIISYIFFGTILALVHSRVSESIEAVDSVGTNEKLITQFFAPIVIIIAAATIYFVNVPSMLAAHDIIASLKLETVEGRLAEFDKALARGSFADQEIVEQLIQQAMSIVNNQNLPESQRLAMMQRAEVEMHTLIEKKPGDARLHNFLATFYRAMGALPQAREQAAEARELSPRKPAIVIEQGVIEVQANQIEAARDFFKEAYVLETSNSQALVLYASTLVILGDVEEAKALIGEEHLDEFAANDFALNAVNKSTDKVFLAELFEKRVALFPNEPQNRASLSYAYYQLGEIDASIEVLEKASVDIPGFSDRAQCFIKNLRSGSDPGEGCE